jgi:hypothetical protein
VAGNSSIRADLNTGVQGQKLFRKHHTNLRLTEFLTIGGAILLLAARIGGARMGRRSSRRPVTLCRRSFRGWRDRDLKCSELPALRVSCRSRSVGSTREPHPRNCSHLALHAVGVQCPLGRISRYDALRTRHRRHRPSAGGQRSAPTAGPPT